MICRKHPFFCCWLKFQLIFWRLKGRSLELPQGREIHGRTNVKKPGNPFPKRVALSYILAEVLRFWDHNNGVYYQSKNHEFPYQSSSISIRFCLKSLPFWQKICMNISSKKLMTVGWIFCHHHRLKQFFCYLTFACFGGSVVGKKNNPQMVANNRDLP